MSDKLTLMEKDGKQIRVHPLSVPNHIQLGWKVVEPSASLDADASEVDMTSARSAVSAETAETETAAEGSSKVTAPKAKKK